MSFLPIAERELRVASRRKSTYWARCVLGLAVGGICFLLLIMGENSMPVAQRGKVLFVAIGVIAFAFSLFAGVFLTADCISEEKREGTLGLLFLTDLKGYDVVLGKLIATSVHAVYGLIAVLPLLAVPMLLGGVTMNEFWRSALVLLATVLLSLCLGMVVSVANRETRRSMALTLLLLLVLAGLLPLALSSFEFLSAPALRPPLRQMLGWPSPVLLYIASFDAYYLSRTGAGNFWASLVTIFLLSGGALLLASLWLPRVWKVKTEFTVAPAVRRARNAVHRAVGDFSRPRLADGNPVEWLVCRDGAPRRLAWTALIPLGAIWFCFFIGGFSGAAVTTQRFCFIVSMLGAYLIHQVLKGLIAMESSRRFSEDRQSGALELLLVTPLSIEEILQGQRKGLATLVYWPMGLLLVMNVLLIFLVIQGFPGDASVFCEMIIGGSVMLAVDFHAMSWIGPWMGWQKRRHHRAVLATFGRVMFVPWLVIFFLVFLTVGGRPMGQEEVMLLSAFWFGLGIVIEFVFVVRAKNGLRENLRERVVPPSAEDAAFGAVPTLLNPANR